MLFSILVFALSVSAIPAPNAYTDFEPGQDLPSLVSLNITIADLAAMPLPPLMAQAAPSQWYPGCDYRKGALVRAMPPF
jgi:hypothetical protein